MTTATAIPAGLCQCGCGGETARARQTDSRKGTRRGERLRFLPFHHQRVLAPAHLIDDAGGCWIWQGHVTDRGYPGLVRRNGRMVRAHRAYYEERFGQIPDELELDHTCRNRACVNPEHLEAVTHAVNVQRSSHARLTAGAVAEVRSLTITRGQRASAAAKYGISPSQFDRIRKETSWRPE